MVDKKKLKHIFLIINVALLVFCLISSISFMGMGQGMGIMVAIIIWCYPIALIALWIVYWILVIVFKLNKEGIKNN